MLLRINYTPSPPIEQVIGRVEDAVCTLLYMVLKHMDDVANFYCLLFVFSPIF